MLSHFLNWFYSHFCKASKWLALYAYECYFSVDFPFISHCIMYIDILLFMYFVNKTGFDFNTVYDSTLWMLRQILSDNVIIFLKKNIYSFIFLRKQDMTYLQEIVSTGEKLRSIKSSFLRENSFIFLISPWKHMLLVLIRSAAPRHFWRVPTCFHGEIRKVSMLFVRKKTLPVGMEIRK